MEFLFDLRLKANKLDLPQKNKNHKTRLGLKRDNILSELSQYAGTLDELIEYIKK